MMSNNQLEQYLQQLRLHHPNAFKRNFVLYGQIKTKGVLDEFKEVIPWILSLLIFGSLSFCLSEIISTFYPKFDTFQALSTAFLSISLFLMLVCPIVLKQIKHSSTSLYRLLQHTPLKLTALIILQALNIAFAQSWILMFVFFFFVLGFGFIKFYKENLFRSSATTTQYHDLQQVRRACFWTYKNIFRINLKLKLCSKNSNDQKELVKLRDQYVQLHIELINLENKLCMALKYSDLENYLDSLM